MTADDFSFERLDRDGALSEAAHDAGGFSRAGFFAAGLAGAAVLLGTVDAEEARAQKPGENDLAILNFALTLEYLQAAFYTEAERLKELRGRTRRAAEVVGSVERAHVKAFRELLGRQAVKRPTFDFQGVTEKPGAFLKTAVAFEDLAVAAYKGQATRLKSARRPVLGARHPLGGGAPRGLDALPVRRRPCPRGLRPAEQQARGHQGREVHELHCHRHQDEA